MSQVLGIRPDTSSETMQRAYKKRLSEAKGDKARIAAVEDAHSQIMMSNLSARLKVRVLTLWAHYNAWHGIFCMRCTSAQPTGKWGRSRSLIALTPSRCEMI